MLDQYWASLKKKKNAQQAGMPYGYDPVGASNCKQFVDHSGNKKIYKISIFLGG